MPPIDNPDKGLHPLERPPPLDVDAFKQELLHRMIREVGRDPSFCSKQDWFYALALVLRERLSMERVNSWRRNFTREAKWVYYLSMELLPGRMLRAFLDAQGLLNVASGALHELGVDLDELWAFEAEPALGTGGLGRLAACILESMATFNYAGQGYSIRYQFGMFRQKIENGQQVEQPDNWLQSASPWEFDRPYASYRVQFRGRVAMVRDEKGDAWHWLDTEDVIATARDLPVMGLAAESVSAVRLWSARATQEFDLNYFNKGDYIDAMEEKSATETLSSVLYPSDATFMGRELRLKQEYFLVSASLQDILSRHAMTYLRIRGSAQPDRDSAERHPSGSRDSRNDAVAGRCSPAGLGPGLGYHGADILVHQPHFDVGSARERGRSS